MQDKFNAVIKKSKQEIEYIVFWLVASLVMGLVGGLFGAAFSKTISLVTDARISNGWLLYLLPIAGILTVAITKLLKVEKVGTNQVFKAVKSDSKVSFWLAPAVFVCSVLTHLCGGSAGREGAALQLGGGTADLFCRILKADEAKKRILIRCGMASFFSAIFGTPLAAGVFVLEVITVGSICVRAIFPVFVSTITAYFTANALGAKAEDFNVKVLPDVSFSVFLKVILLSVVAAAVGYIFCKTLHFTEHLFKRYIKNNYLKAIIGGMGIILLTLILGTRDYNGSGIDVINRIFESGQVRYEAFLLKIIFTALTVAAGFKGGEIVPTLFIGATFGGAFGSLLGLTPAFSAALGMSGLFCAVTNSPLATILLAAEMFGSDGLIFYTAAVIIAFVLSGKCSLYSEQEISESL